MFRQLMFTPTQIQEIRKQRNRPNNPNPNPNNPHNLVDDQSQFYMGIANYLVRNFRNYGAALSIVEELAKVEQREYTSKESQLIFYLRVLQMNLYDKHNLKTSYEEISRQDPYKVF